MGVTTFQFESWKALNFFRESWKITRYYLDTREARPKFRFLDEKFMSKDVPRADFGPHSVDKAWHGLLWAGNHHRQNFANPETDSANPENPEILKQWHPCTQSSEVYL